MRKRQRGEAEQERRQAAQRAMAEHGRFADLFERAPVGYLVLERHSTVLQANATALTLLRRPRAAVVGLPLVVHAVVSEQRALAGHIAHVIDGRTRGTCQVTFDDGLGTGLVAHLVSAAAREPSGRYLCRTVLSDATPFHAAEEEHATLLARERQRSENAEQRQRQLDRVVTAAALLAETLDVDAAAAGAVRVAVPTVASYCAIDLLDGAGRLRRAAFFREGDERDLPLDPYAPHGSATVVRSGELALGHALGLGDLLGLAAEAGAIPELRAAVGAFLMLPLRAHGHTLGAITFARGPGQAFTPEDVPLALELARHTALALDNARLYREAQEADRRKDEFLAMLGHELRNPLAAVVMAGALLAQKEAHSAVAKRTADLIARQGGRLTRLVDDLLDVSRVTRGKISLDRRPVLLAEVVARAAESVRPLIEERRHTLSLRAPVEPLVVDGDLTRLEQVVVNLLVNAAKYTPQGGHVDVDLTHAGGDAELRVRDDGVGIEPERLADVFVPFTQLETTIDRTDRGLGIGLTLARQLVEMHGGHVIASSEGRGRGTEMLVRLPLAAVARTLPPPEADGVTPPVAPRRRRVLVVEDHPDVAALLQDELAALGQEVRVARDGPEGVGAALSFQPEVLFIDIGLPGLSGYEVARRLRREPALAQARMVALTGYGGDETEQRCLEAGFDRHFTKPISEAALRDQLDTPSLPLRAPVGDAEQSYRAPDCAR